MSKKIRFPLKMANGADVRTIEELRENFDLESVLGYYASGKLVTWLSDRYYDTESEKISSIDASSGDLNKQICEILGVEYTDESSETDIESLRIRNEKIAKLRQITDKQEIIEAVDSVAFDQDELFDLLDEDVEVIYLCGEKFSIPLGKKNIRYIGVNSPLVILGKQSIEVFNSNNICFKNVQFEPSLREKVNLVQATDNSIKTTFDKNAFEEWLLSKYSKYSYKNYIGKYIELFYTVWGERIFYYLPSGEYNESSDYQYFVVHTCNFNLNDKKVLTCEGFKDFETEEQASEIYSERFMISELKELKRKGTTAIQHWGKVIGKTNNYIFLMSENNQILIDGETLEIQKYNSNRKPAISRYITNGIDDEIICLCYYKNWQESYEFSGFGLVKFDLDNSWNETVIQEYLFKKSDLFYEGKIYYATVRRSGMYRTDEFDFSRSYWRNLKNYIERSGYKLSERSVYEYTFTLYCYDVKNNENREIQCFDDFTVYNNTHYIKDDMEVKINDNDEYQIKVVIENYDKNPAYKFEQLYRIPINY